MCMTQLETVPARAQFGTFVWCRKGARKVAEQRISSKGKSPEPAATYDGDVEPLLHHWSSLSDTRKTEFAQMAVLLR